MAVSVIMIFNLLFTQEVRPLILTTEPSSVNVSLVGEAVFLCSAEEDLVNGIQWRNNSALLILTSNSSLGITINDPGGTSSRTSMLRIEGRPEFNETRVQCLATGVTAAGDPAVSASSEAILLIQGPLDRVSGISFMGVGDCCKSISWEEPYSLDGVPILGYNVTSTDLNHDSFVTGSTETVVCSNQLQHDNATVIIQAYNGVDGDVASLGLEFNIDTQPVIKIGKEQLASGGQNWTLPITIVKLVCNGMFEDLDMLTITVRDEGNGSVIQQTTVPINGMEVVHLSLPDNQKFLLRDNFTLSFSNGLSLSSVLSLNRTISTFDFRDVLVDCESENKACLRCEAIANSRAEACLLHVNSTENETDQAFIITPDPTSIYRTCVDVVPGTYNLTAFDVSSEVGPLTVTPAVVVTSVLICTMTITSSIDFSTTSPSSPSATPAPAVFVVAIIVFSILGILVLSGLVVVIVTVLATINKRKARRGTQETAAPVYENMKPPSGIEMQECPAYATVNQPF